MKSKDSMDFLKIENAAFHSWPAFEHFNRDGWVYRFANGFTKRANSVNVLNDHAGGLEQRVVTAEEEYNRRNLRCVFRLLSFNTNSGLEDVLDRRGYNKGDHSLVLVQKLWGKRFETPVPDCFEIEKWGEQYSRFGSGAPCDDESHFKMVQRIKDNKIFVLQESAGIIVSCGLGVVHGGYFGIFDIRTHPGHRRSGHAYHMISGMLAWAVKNGAHTAYVQVVAENFTAVKLYDKLGYAPGYEYHYKIQNRNLKHA